VELASALRKDLASLRGIDLAVCPPSVFLQAVSAALNGSNVLVGAQNMCWAESGAFTGEVGAAMLKDVGCRLVILGHSERRHVFGEKDSEINAKMKAALAGGLDPICCVGEKLDERDAGRIEEVIKRQVRSGPSAPAGMRPPPKRRKCTCSSGRCWRRSTTRTSPRPSASTTAAASKRKMRKNSWRPPTLTDSSSAAPA
jgi:hypothetical protein